MEIFIFIYFIFLDNPWYSLEFNLGNTTLEFKATKGDLCDSSILLSFTFDD